MQNYFTPDIETASRDYLTAIQSARLIKMVELLQARALL